MADNGNNVIGLISTLITAAAGITGVGVGLFYNSRKERHRQAERGQRFELALGAEVHKNIRLIHAKMKWLQRADKAGIAKQNPSRFVLVDGQNLYLGEAEQFHLPSPFWTTNNTEIVSLISTGAFDRFVTAYQLFDLFQAKFADLKEGFNHSEGNPKDMALACYQDLVQIQKFIRTLEKELPPEPAELKKLLDKLYQLDEPAKSTNSAKTLS